NFLGRQMVFAIKDKENLKRYINTPFLLVYTTPTLVTGSYIGRLRASWAEVGAGVINLSMNGPNPAKDIDFLTGLIKNYRKADEDKKKQSATNTIIFIESQLQDISDSLQRVELQVERFKNENVITDMSREAYRLYEKLEQLELQKAQLGIKKNYYQYVDNYIRKGEKLDQVILPTSIGIEDAILTALISQMVNLQMEFKLATSNEKLENPILLRHKDRIDAIKDDILESIEQQQATDRIQEEFFNKQLAELERQLSHLPVAERQ